MGVCCKEPSFGYLFYYDADKGKYYSEDALNLYNLAKEFKKDLIKRGLPQDVKPEVLEEKPVCIEKKDIEPLIQRLKSIDFSTIIFEQLDECFMDGWSLTLRISSDRDSFWESNALSVKLHCPDYSKSTSETKKLFDLCKDFCILAGNDSLYKMDLANKRFRGERK